MLAVQDQRPFRINREGGCAGDSHRLDGRDADHRHIEPHILLGLRDFHDPHAWSGQMSGAPDHFVGAFHRLDGDHGLVLHGDHLYAAQGAQESAALNENPMGRELAIIATAVIADLYAQLSAAQAAGPVTADAS